MICEGDVIKCKMPFEDGTVNDYQRYFLVLKAEEQVTCLNVSSVKGKEKKLLFPSNKEIIEYNPPFPFRTMVKLDSLYLMDSIENIISYKFGSISECALAEIKRQYFEYENNPTAKFVELECGKALFELHN